MGDFVLIRSLCIAVNTAVDFLLRIRKPENMLYSLFRRRYAARIFAFQYINQLFRKLYVPFFRNLSVLYDIYRYIRTHKTKNVHIDVYIRIYLYNILAPHLMAGGVFYYSDGTVKLVEIQHLIYLHRFSRLNVIYDYAVFNRVDIQLFHLQKLHDKRHSDKFAVFCLFEVAGARIVVHRDGDFIYPWERMEYAEIALGVF